MSELHEDSTLNITAHSAAERVIAAVVLIVCIGYCVGVLPSLLPTALSLVGFGLPGWLTVSFNWTLGLGIYAATGGAVLLAYMRIR